MEMNRQTNKNVNHIFSSLGNLPVLCLNIVTVKVHYRYLRCMICNGQNNRNKKLALTSASIDSYMKYIHFIMA